VTINGLFSIGSYGVDRAFESVIVGKKFTVGTGDLVHGLTLFHGGINAAHDCPD
jgi:hypothetical protein